ncbi:MAG: hydrolase TatD [Opitutia bacterium Tous-C1TDCM]|nr:MAG: hydrolase TatD [Opitutae bacterium Tous-C1TDCM]
MTPLCDAHNHFQDDWLRPHRDAVAADLARLPLAAAVVNGTCEADWADVAALAETYPWVRPSFGLHPWDVGNASPHWRDALLHRLAQPLPRGLAPAIGEIGLDRWILDHARPDDPRLAGLRRASLDEQQTAFRWQLELAAARNLPVSIHCLEAWGPLLETLRTSPLPARGFLLHAYGGSAEMAETFASLGAFFSFNAFFLGDRHAAKRAVFARLPSDRILVETDAPAMLPPESEIRHRLPPAPDGAAINHPANLEVAYAGLAALRGLSVPALAATVAANFRHCFGP